MRHGGARNFVIRRLEYEHAQLRLKKLLFFFVGGGGGRGTKTILELK